MRLTWFLFGAATASAVWYIAVSELGRRWIGAILGGA